MLVHIEIVHKNKKKNLILCQGKERTAKTECLLAKHCIVLACGELDSAQCYPAQSLTPGSVILCGI